MPDDCPCSSPDAAECAAQLMGIPVELVTSAEQCACRCHYQRGRDDDEME